MVMIFTWPSTTGFQRDVYKRQGLKMVGKYKGVRPEIEYTKAMGKKVNYLEGKDPSAAQAADGSHNLRSVSYTHLDRSTMVKGMDVVYIYHDTIDEASHTSDTMVFPACDDAIQELKNLTKIICNDVGATHILDVYKIQLISWRF